MSEPLCDLAFEASSQGGNVMPDAYERLRSLPILDVLLALGWDASAFKVRKQGTEFSGKCPVHGGKTNNTAFNFALDGKWHCFSCEAKGKGAIDLVMAVRQVGFQEAVTFLGGLAAPSPQTQLRTQPSPAESAALSSSENPPFKATYDKYAVPSAWLKARGLTEATLKHYEVFEYNNPARRSVYTGSVMLKIRRWSDGECVGYLSRNIGEVTPEKPKYSFPKGMHKALELWGAYQIKDDEERLRILYVVESPFSVMHFHQLGLPAVSLLGWSVSPQQLHIIVQLAKGVVYLPDSDKRKEAQAYAGLLATRLWCRFPEMPKPDPEQLSKEQILALA